MSTSPARRRTLDFVKPERSLAEWSSKIRELQAQVDHDEALEQQLLEEEIARSRLERARRRNTAGSALAAASYRMNLNRLPDDLQQVADQQQHHSDALRKLTGEIPARTSTPLSSSLAAEGSPTQSIDPPQSSQSSATSKPAIPGPSATTKPLSLAEFMGGTASGPRLNKHAPQPDETNPILFTPQRSMKDLPGSRNSAGFALPGLATPARQAQSSSQASSPAPVQAPWVSSSARSASPFASSTAPQPTTKSSTPEPRRSLSRSGNNSTHNATVPISVGGRSVSPHNALTAGREPEHVSTLVQDPPSRPTPVGTPPPKSSIISRWPPAAALDSTPPPKSASPRPLRSSPSLSSSISTPTSHNLTSSPALSSSTGRSPQHPSLARPIQPSPVTPQTFLPPTSKPSPAFQRAAPPKEERPSITRLKGRRFVEKRVQASAYLTDLAKATEPLERRSSSSGPPEKKLSVLARWPEMKEGSDSPNKASIKDSPLLKSSSKPQWPPVSTSSDSPGTSPSPGFRATRSASPSIPEVRKERNPEHDATPLRLPGMANARPLPTKGQSQPTPKDGSTDHFAPATSNRTVASPVRLPGMATTASLPSSDVIGRSAPPNLLKMSGRRRSVHFEDDAEILKSKIEYDTDRDDCRGAVTDPGGSNRLTHLTKERARKPKKGGSTGRAAASGALTPLREVYKPPGPERPNSERVTASVPQQTTMYPSPAPVTPVSPTAPALKPKPSPPVDPPVVQQRPEVNAAKGPPIIQPKPVAYRRPSQSSGDESSHTKRARPGLVSTAPSSQSPRPVLSHTPSSSLRTDSFVEHTQRDSSRPTEQQEDEHSMVNIRAAIAAWGQKSSVPPSPGPGSSVGAERERPKSAVIDLGEREDEEPPKVDVRSVIASWGRASASPSSTPTPVQIQIGRPAPAPPSPVSPSPSPLVSQPSAPQSPTPQARPRPVNPNNSVERRRSKNFDRYSAVMMPPLKEEKTPIATPEGSMKVAVPGVPPSVQAIHDSLLKADQGKHGDRPNSGSDDTAVDEVELVAGTTEGHVKESSIEKKLFLEVEEGTSGKEQVMTSAPVSPMDEVVRLEHDDGTIGSFNLTALLASRPAAPKAIQGTISVESFTISGSTSTLIDSEPHILYDGDIVAIVHRAKGKTSDLVTTTVWGWEGRHSQCSETERKKLNELASRFGTKLANAPQGKEPFEMAQVLGGTIIIRHGSRAHWTAENTAFYCVRMHGHHYVMIEEVELESVNLCSAFSYCLTVLDSLYIWHGKGSIKAERQAAVNYAQFLKGQESVEPTVLEEGSEDEMFWLMLGEGGYASADYWRFRTQSMVVTPRLWNVQPQGGLAAIQPFCADDLKPDGVYLFDGVFELFVIVGVLARGKRGQIRLALAAAEATSAASAVTRIFPPPVHVLIFPTRVPVDLRANFRLFDEEKVNGQEVPDHINLLTLEEGQEQLAKLEWTRRQLRDSDFLPLGIDPSKVP